MSQRPESKRREVRPNRREAPSVAEPQRSEETLAPGLWLVATPIGNAADISLRAMDVLNRADILACEDTRRTRKLMDIHGISLNGRRAISYNDQNGAGRRPQIMALLAEGRSVAYASDAGTPLIADPGYRLVEAARENGHAIHVVPGASAVLAALSVAGLPTDRFMFMGFLPVKTNARKREFAEVAKLRSTLVFFESPRRLGAMLKDAVEVFEPSREAVVVRELTKTFEEVHRSRLDELARDYEEKIPKGEVVVVIGPPIDATDTLLPESETVEALIQKALETLSVKDAAKEVSKTTGLPKREVYEQAVRISQMLRKNSL